MLHLGSIYLLVKDVNASIAFYTSLLGFPPTARNGDRWIQFDFEGHCIALYNDAFDAELLASKSREELKNNFDDAYIAWYTARKIQYGNNFTLNFGVEDLRAEYERLQGLAIGKMSALMYLNIASPYHFFTIEDPDGNTIEIAGALDV